MNRGRALGVFASGCYRPCFGDCVSLRAPHVWRSGSGDLVTLILMAALLTTAPGRAESTPGQLRWEPHADIPVTGALIATWALTEFPLKTTLAPTTCRSLCEPNAFDTSVRRVFNPSLQPTKFGFDRPDLVSNLVGFGAIPVALFGLDALLSRWKHGDGPFWADATLMLEASFAALALNQAIKFAVGRARPYTIGASRDLLASARAPNDHFLSFFSGHSTFAFAMAVSAGMIATLRNESWAWLTWLVGIPLAAGTAVLRLAADKHWATDVLVGSGWGALVGAGLPLLFHGRESSPPVTLSVSSEGIRLAGAW